MRTMPYRTGQPQGIVPTNRPFTNRIWEPENKVLSLKENKYMIQQILKIILIAALVTSFAGCAGRAADPVMTYQYGDDKKSCSALELEMTFVESEIRRLIPETYKTSENVILGVTGAFLLVPLFFMDFSEAEQVEVNAFRRRYNHLAILSEEKNCGFEVKPVKEFTPTPE